jgi:dipeptidyl aminopeptidase/acylaminoacyl peptidase
MRFAFALATALGFTITAVQAAEPPKTTPIEIEALAQFEAFDSARLSPDGKHLVALVASPKHKWPVISIWEVENLTKPPIWIPSESMRPVSVRFLGNGHILFFAEQPFTGNSELTNFISVKTFTVKAIVADIEGKKFREPFAAKGAMSDTERDNERLGVNFALVLEGSIDNPDRYLIEKTNLKSFDRSLWAIDVKTMQVSRAIQLADDESVALIDKQTGEVVVKEGLRSESGGWQLIRGIRNKATGSFEEHPALGYPVKQRTTINPLGFFDSDPNKLYVSINRGSDFASVLLYDIRTGKFDSEPAFASPTADIIDVDPAVDVEGKKIIGVGSYTIGGPVVREVFVDDLWAPIQRSVEKTFTGQNVVFVNTVNKLKRALVFVSSPANPGEYYLLDNGRDLRLLGKVRPWINPKSLGNATYVTYKARDGLMIPGFLYLPPGYNAATHGRIPVVIHPHGGPWSRDALDWDGVGWAQFLATRGYAVLQPQYRGSTGFGMNLWKAGDKEWGQKMQDDKDDGAAWLVSQGIGDPKRMAIFGYSYGGFAAIAASVRPNSPYRCAIAGAGVANLKKLGNLWGQNRVGREIQGWTVDGMDPILNVDKANIPILLYHGDRDRQADTYHSREFYSAMKGASKDVEYHEIKDMWHTIPWWPEWHRLTLGLIENYLAGPKCFGAK